MGEGVECYVRDVLVRKRIEGLLATSVARHEADGPEHSQVLGGERLGDPERVDQLVHTSRPFGELENDGEAVGGAECP
jgi:hypothetical protein